MVHQNYPFVGKSYPELYYKIQNDEPEYQEGLDPDLLDLFRGMLDKDPDKRYNFAEIKENAWLTNNGMRPLESLTSSEKIKISSGDVEKVIKMIKVNFMRKIKFKVKKK